MTTGESRLRQASRLLLAAVMVGAGALHFISPGTYQPLIPPQLGPPRPWVYGSGVVEMGAGALLAVPRTRRLGGWAIALVLLAVWPGNWKMAIDGGYPGASGLAGSPVASWIRVPLQIPLILWALSYTRPKHT